MYPIVVQSANCEHPIVIALIGPRAEISDSA
jgi:hypothetical protein